MTSDAGKDGSESGRETLKTLGPDGRYVLAREIASGGMASVHLALHRGDAGFNRVVAVKRLRPELAEDSEFVAMMMDEARLGSRVTHPNVVTVLDVVQTPEEVALVLEYVHGESLARLLKISRESGEPIPADVVAAILTGALRGLHHAHHARDALGAPLGLVHRDVSPQNILVDATGIAKVADFGIAKAQGRLQQTEFGQIKGKIAYMAPEQLYGNASIASDIFAMGVVAWEAFTSQRLFHGKTRNETAQAVLEAKIPPFDRAANVPEPVERAVMAALSRDPSQRPASALDLALAIEGAMRVADPSEVGAWVRSVCGEGLKRREREIRDLESRVTDGPSSRTLARARTAQPRKRRAGIGVLLSAAGIALALVVGLVVGRGRTPASPAPEPMASSPEAPATRAQNETETTTLSSAPPSPTPSVAARPLEAATGKPAVSKHPTRASPAPSRSAKKQKACDPPTYIDAKGVTRYKPECF